VLVALRVRNFILMDEMELRLEPGLNVLTGETGAGKSIVVGAISLVLGGRASSEVVRPGAAEAEVEALFDVRGALAIGATESESDVLRPAREAGLVVDGELSVRRVVNEGGRSRAYLSGRLATAAELSAIGPALADVASQHESVALSDPATHLGHLDRFAHLGAARAAVEAGVTALEDLAREIRALREQERSRGEREAFLSFQLQAIDAVAPRGGEIEELHAERKRLRHAGKLAELAGHATARLDGDSGGACDAVARAAADLRAASDLDPSLAPLAARLDACRVELADVAHETAELAESSFGDPARLGQVEDRLWRLEQLLRQYGPTIDDVLATQRRVQSELESLAGAGGRAAELEAEIALRLVPVAEAARALSRQRRAAASDLGRRISDELAALGMGGARVVVDVESLTLQEEGRPGALAVDGARLGRDGIDRVEFLISPNKGIDPKPLRKIASGGELSRALLSLKRVLAEHGPAGLYVFDEVDSGVGGAVAERIGQAIADVARHHQVLCITHLAPIAAYADAHFVVSKSNDGDVTKSRLTRVEDDARDQEIARMLGGAKVTEATLGAARELVRGAREARAEMATSAKVSTPAEARPQRAPTPSSPRTIPTTPTAKKTKKPR